MRPIQSRIISACRLGWRASHVLLVIVMFTSPDFAMDASLRHKWMMIVDTSGGCFCLCEECAPFGDSKRWSQSVGMCRHKLGSPVDGSGEVLLSPGCCYRKGPVHWGLLFLLRGLPVGHLRGLGGQGESLLCLLCFDFPARGMIVRGAG